MQILERRLRAVSSFQESPQESFARFGTIYAIYKI